VPAVTDHVPEFAPYLDDPTYSPFWAAAERGQIALPACPVCGVFQWYPLPGRPCGHTGPLEWRDLPGTGTIFTFSRVERAFLPSGGEPPYTVIFVELDGAPGPRLVTVLVGDGSATPAIGDRVVLAPTRTATHTLPTFALAGGQDLQKAGTP
jgi:uncharacterized protein